jgi:hypothetical protein
MATLKVIAFSAAGNSALVSMNVPVPGTPFVTSVTGNITLDDDQAKPEVGDTFTLPESVQLTTTVNVTDDGREFTWFRY